MNPDDIDIDAYVATAAPTVGFTIDPQYREEVTRQFTLIARAAALLHAADDATWREEPAPVFTPGPHV